PLEIELGDPKKKKGERALMTLFQQNLPRSSWPDSEDRDGYLRTAKIMLPIYIRAHKYLASTGWISSVKLRRPVDAKKNPLPWYTYPSIYFLDTQDLSKLKVFEYGSGSSTLWWSERALSVTAVEHHQGWYDEISLRIPKSTKYIFQEMEYGGDYGRMAEMQNTKFDIIVIDGRDRVNCAKSSLNALSDNGIIVWDNAERERYSDGYNLLLAEGFKRLDFYGHGPINTNSWLTSIFYRADNCLGI
ncbi:MAG: hypothetical protein ACK4Y4_03375, partial [Brevundimonas sp.]